jgi:hypothetical protein
MFHPHFLLHVALTVGTSGGSPETFQNAMLFPKSGGGVLDSKVLSTYLNPQNFLKDNNVPFTQFKWRRRKRNEALSKGITQPLPHRNNSGQVTSNLDVSSKHHSYVSLEGQKSVVHAHNRAGQCFTAIPPLKFQTDHRTSACKPCRRSRTM